MRLLIFPAIISASGLYETIPGTTNLRFKNGTDFYKKYEKNILRGSADCMQSSSFTLANGQEKTFPGIYWAE